MREELGVDFAPDPGVRTTLSGIRLKLRHISGPMRKYGITVGILFAVSLASASAAERAWYGFHIKPETAGFPLNPIVKSVVIDKVKVNSPASAQHIRVGDEIIEADGRIVRGARAMQLIFLLNKEPGNVLHLRLKRADGESYTVVVQGIKKPRV